MTNETTETHVITDLPSKKSKLHNPFAKKDGTAPADTNETKPNRKVPHGIYAFGALLLAGSAVAAVGSKLRKSGDDESNVPTDTVA